MMKKFIFALLLSVMVLGCSQGEDDLAIDDDGDLTISIEYTQRGPYIALNEDWSIIFHQPYNEEKLKIAPNGDFFVNGELTANNVEVYEKFKEWLFSEADKIGLY